MMKRLLRMAESALSLRPVASVERDAHVLIGLDHSLHHDRSGQSDRLHEQHPSHKDEGADHEIEANAQTTEASKIDAGPAPLHEVPRPAVNAWQHSLILGMGLPDDELLATASETTPPDGLLLCLVARPIPDPDDEEPSTDLLLSMLLEYGFDLLLDGKIGGFRGLLARRLTVKDTILQQAQRAPVDRRFWMPVKGSCMIPILREGDLVLADLGTSVRRGEVAVVQGPPELMVHRILARFHVAGTGYILHGGQNGGMYLTLQAKLLGRALAVRHSDDSVPLLLNRDPAPWLRYAAEFARLWGIDTRRTPGRQLTTIAKAIDRLGQRLAAWNDSLHDALSTQGLRSALTSIAHISAQEIAP